MCDMAMMDIWDAGDAIEEERSAPGDDDNPGNSLMQDSLDSDLKKKLKVTKPKKKTEILDSWEDEDESSEPETEESSTEDSHLGEIFPSESNGNYDEHDGLVMVYKAFQLLQEEFDEKFRNEWA